MADETRSDEELMRAYVAGDAHAFRQLFDRYTPVLLGVLRRQVRSEELARDLAQQTFLQLHRSRHDFSADRRLRPWLFTIAMNLMREHFRRRGRRPETSLEAVPWKEPAVGPRGQHQADARRDLARGLAQLSAEQREVIALHWLGGVPMPEIAATLGVSLSAVKLRAHRGYAALRTLLGSEAPGAPGEER